MLAAVSTVPTDWRSRLSFRAGDLDDLSLAARKEEDVGEPLLFFLLGEAAPYRRTSRRVLNLVRRCRRKRERKKKARRGRRERREEV